MLELLTMVLLEFSSFERIVITMTVEDVNCNRRDPKDFYEKDFLGEYFCLG